MVNYARHALQEPNPLNLIMERPVLLVDQDTFPLKDLFVYPVGQDLNLIYQILRVFLVRRAAYRREMVITVSLVVQVNLQALIAQFACPVRTDMFLQLEWNAMLALQVANPTMQPMQLSVNPARQVKYRVLPCPALLVVLVSNLIPEIVHVCHALWARYRKVIPTIVPHVLRVKSRIFRGHTAWAVQQGLFH